MEIGKQKRILWDTCICIDYIQAKYNNENYKIKENDKDNLESINKIWERYSQGKIEIFASTLVIVESVKIEGLMPPIQVLYARKFFEAIRENVISVGIDVAIKAHAIRSIAQIKLSQYDSIHLASAMVGDIPIVITNDKGILERDNKYKTGKGNYIRILTPQRYIELILEEEKQKREDKKQKEIVNHIQKDKEIGQGRIFDEFEESEK